MSEKKDKGKEIMVSVVIPVYNRPVELKRAIESVLIQTFQDFEIIVVDDGSENEKEIEKVCSSFDDERIRFIKDVQHKNADVARNTGIRNAKGRYVAMLDSDDEFLPEHLQRRIDKIEKWGCDGIFGSAYVFDGQKEKIKYCRPLGKNEKMADYLFTDGFCPAPSHFYRIDAAKNILWNESLICHQDYDFSIRFAEKFDFRCDPVPTIRINWIKGYKHKLNETHFESQKRFIEKYREEVSLAALANYFYSMKKDALAYGKKKQASYWRSEMQNVTNSFFVPFLIGQVRLKAALRRVNRAARKPGSHPFSNKE